MDNSNVNIDLIRGHVDTIILKALYYEDKYGYEILNEIKEKSKGMYTLKQPTLYSCLKRLEKQGYIRSYKGDTSNGAQRVYYSLQPAGRAFLESDQHQWEFSRTIINSLLSDQEFDPDKHVAPFDPSNFRPLTRRQKSSPDDDMYASDYSSDDNSCEESFASSQVTEPASNLSEPVIQKEVPYYQENNDIEDKGLEYNNNDNYQNKYTYESISDSDADISKNVENYHSSAYDQPIASNINDNVESGYAKKVENYDDNRVINQENKRDDFSYFSANIPSSTNNQSKHGQTYTDTDQDLSGGYTNRQTVNYIDSFDSIYNVPMTQVTPSDNSSSMSGDDEKIEYLSTAELKAKMMSEGYNLRPYVKKNTSEYYINQYYYCNKLKRDSSIITYIIYAIGVLVAYFSTAKTYGTSLGGMIGFLAAGLLYPGVMMINFAVDPYKRVKATFNAKNAVINSLIVIINAVILIVLIGFLGFKANVSDIKTLVVPVIIPLFFLLLIPIAIAIYYRLYTTKHYHVN